MKDNNVKLKSIYDTSVVIKNNDLLNFKKEVSNKIKNNKTKIIKNNRLELLNNFKNEILLMAIHDIPLNEIANIIRANFNLKVSAKQISDYLKEYLKIKRFGGNGGKLAYIDDEGKFIKHVDINELDIKDL
ncbi:hypothetical protein AVBRAN9334_02955 [Campylobacter sp. RM9334]|uniref:hypothetical protein n=1 Tax=Campylobacter sp. RM9334 TaxID=2735732 RepID=UPI001DB1477B|nr:hypothetical protein [Campylobacter sp. RM9334]